MENTRGQDIDKMSKKVKASDFLQQNLASIVQRNQSPAYSMVMCDLASKRALLTWRKLFAVDIKGNHREQSSVSAILETLPTIEYRPKNHIYADYHVFTSYRCSFSYHKHKLRTTAASSAAYATPSIHEQSHVE